MCTYVHFLMNLLFLSSFTIFNRKWTKTDFKFDKFPSFNLNVIRLYKIQNKIFLNGANLIGISISPCFCLDIPLIGVRFWLNNSHTNPTY